MLRKNILDPMGGQIQVKVTKGHQVRIFKKCFFELQCTEKVSQTSWTNFDNAISVTVLQPKMWGFG